LHGGGIHWGEQKRSKVVNNDVGLAGGAKKGASALAPLTNQPKEMEDPMVGQNIGRENHGDTRENGPNTQVGEKNKNNQCMGKAECPMEMEEPHEAPCKGNARAMQDPSGISKAQGPVVVPQ
jgi:hypothetical protein